MNATTPHDSLDDILGEYLQQVEAGQVPDRAALLAQYPQQAERLRVIFADQDRLDGQAPGLRLTATSPHIGDYDATSAPETIRYFGDYELLEKLAEGGMGIVNKARQVTLNRLVALKRILKGRMASLVDIARFRLEAEAVANLDHPNIIPIYEVGEHENQQYFAMKYLDGGTLTQRPRGTPQQEASLMLKIVRAVEFAHRRGVLHRDLKPGNILFDAAGEPCVADFGLAKRLDRDDPALTVSGDALGTPLYMPPEQAAGRRDITVTADVYSLGVILYERLTGRTPFQGKDRLSILRQVRESEPPSLSSLNTAIPRDLQTLCLRCLEKEPARRYSTAGELADELERFLRGEPILARPVSRVERAWRWMKRHPWPTAAAAAMLLGVIISLAFGAWAITERDRAVELKGRTDEYAVKLEKTMARGFLRPFSVGPWETLGQNRVEDHHRLPLWELAENRGEDVWFRFIEEALREENTTRQLMHNSQVLLHAAVGLDLRKHDRLENWLAARMTQPELHEQRLNTALLLVTLGGLSPQTAKQVCDVLIDSLVQDKHLHTADEHELAFKQLAHAVSPEGAKRYVGLLWSSCVSRKDAFASHCLRMMHMMVLQLDQETKTTLLPQLIRQLSSEKAAPDIEWYFELLLALHPHDTGDMADELVQQSFDVLIQSMQIQKEQFRASQLAQRLIDHLQRMTPDNVRKHAAALMKVIQKEEDPLKLAAYVTLIAKLADRLEVAQARQYRTLACNQIAFILKRYVENVAVIQLVDALSLIAPSLDLEVAMEVKASIIQHLLLSAEHKEHDTYKHRLLEALELLARHWTHPQWPVIAEKWIRIIHETGGASDLKSQLVKRVPTLILRLTPEDTHRLSVMIVDMITHAESNALQMGLLLQVLADLIKQRPGLLKPEQYQRLTSCLLLKIEHEAFRTRMEEMKRGISECLPHWPPDQASILRERALKQLMLGLSTAKEYDIQNISMSINSLLADQAPGPVTHWRLAQALYLVNALELPENSRSVLRLASELRTALDKVEGPQAAEIVHRAANHLKRMKPTKDYAREDIYFINECTNALYYMACLMKHDQLQEHFAWCLDAISDERVAMYSHSGTLPNLSDIQEWATEYTHARPQHDAFTTPAQLALTLASPFQSGITLGTQLTWEAVETPLFSDEFIVQLLQRPIGINPWRRVLLDVLGTRHRRYFRDQWDYVRFAQQQNLGIDFTAGPQRKLPWKESYRAP